MRFLRGCVAVVLCTTACSNEQVTTATTESQSTSSAGAVAITAAPLEQDRPGLLSQAAISDADARAIALQRVPGGQIVEGELEAEGGTLVYEYEVRAAGGRRTIEVKIDARTGAVLRVDAESEDGEDAEDGEDRDGPEDAEPRR